MRRIKKGSKAFTQDGCTGDEAFLGLGMTAGGRGCAPLPWKEKEKEEIVYLVFCVYGVVVIEVETSSESYHCP